MGGVKEWVYGVEVGGEWMGGVTHINEGQDVLFEVLLQCGVGGCQGQEVVIP